MKKLGDFPLKDLRHRREIPHVNSEPEQEKFWRRKTLEKG